MGCCVVMRRDNDNIDFFAYIMMCFEVRFPYFLLFHGEESSLDYGYVGEWGVGCVIHW